MEKIKELYGYLAEFGVLLTEDNLQEVCDTLNEEEGVVRFAVDDLGSGPIIFIDQYLIGSPGLYLVKLADGSFTVTGEDYINWAKGAEEDFGAKTEEA